MHIVKLFYICLVICLLSGCACFPPAATSSSPINQAYWPAREWRASTPEEQGLDSEMLARMFQQVEEEHLNLHSVLIVHNGYLVTEAYFHPYTQHQPQWIASVTKSVIGTLVGIAIQKGHIKDANQRLVSFFSDQNIAKLDERKNAITLKNLLTLTAGLKCNDAPFSGEAGMEQSDNWVQFMLDAPMTEQPGTKWNYCGGAVHLLSAVLQKTTGMKTRDFANRYLFEPLGIPTVPEERWITDPQGISTGQYGLYLTPRDLAKLGYLYMQNGRWDDQQILPAEWVKTATTSQAHKDDGLDYGYLWTVDSQQGSFSALGFAGQQIYVIPSENLVVVFTAALPTTAPNMDFIPLKGLMDRYILPAVKSAAALPPNPAAVKKLNELVNRAANPKQAVQPIPEGALQWSGLVYQLDPNPNQWETISFGIANGADTMTIRIDGEAVDPSIGLDHLYRIQKQAGVFAPQAMRGYWENDTTLYVQLINIGELNDNEFRAVFSADELTVTGRGVVNGLEIRLHGKCNPK